MELDKGVMGQLGISSDSNTELDFDAKGTVHIMERGADGELLNDSPLHQIAGSSLYSDSDELRRELEELCSRNDRINKRVFWACGCTLLLVVFCVVLIVYLRR